MSMGPTPPSPSSVVGPAVQAAQAQIPYSTAAQQASMINQQGPTGSLRYSSVMGPNGVPITTAVNQLSPQQQQLLDQLVGTQTTAGGQAQDLLTRASYGSQTPSQAIGNMTSGMTGQMMGQELSFLDPFFKTQTSQLDAQLKNQGLGPGNPAYDNAMRQTQTNQGLQVNQFLASAFPQAAQIATTQYGLPMQMAESLGQFGAPANLTTGFTSALPGFKAPDVSAGLGPLAGLTTAQAQQQQAQYNAMMGGLFGIGSAGLAGLAMA